MASPVWGSKPSGLIYYDTAGNMAAQIMADRPRPAWKAPTPTPEEAVESVIGYVAYFGTYEVDATGKTVTHHRKASVNPNWVNVDAVRRYEFVGEDRIVLTAVETPTTRLVWERVSK